MERRVEVGVVGVASVIVPSSGRRGDHNRDGYGGRNDDPATTDLTHETGRSPSGDRPVTTGETTMYNYQKRTKRRKEQEREQEDLMPIGMFVFMMICVMGWMFLLASIPIKI